MKVRRERIHDLRIGLDSFCVRARYLIGPLLLCLGVFECGVLPTAELPAASAAVSSQAKQKPTMRIGAAQPKSRLVDYHLNNPAEVLAQLDRSLGELEEIVHKGGTARCDVLPFPQDPFGR